jgi:Putative zincin peptidase
MLILKRTHVSFSYEERKMQSVMILPVGYEQDRILDFSKNKVLPISLSLASLVAFFVFGTLFLLLASKISPSLGPSGMIVINIPILLKVALVLSVVTLLIMIVHEFIHGIFFWIFTRSQPKYGFKGLYAYAAAPDWYIPRNQFLVIGLAPLIILTLLGLVSLTFLPFTGAIIVVFAMTMNAAGAVGDLFVVGLSLTKPTNCLFRDFGNGITLYKSS